MKKTILWATVLLLAFAAYPVSAQEFIKRTQLYGSEEMIIRDYTGDSWLVYDRYREPNGSKHDVFILFTETGSTAEMMFLPEQVACVNDFEIYDNTVYFAGCSASGAGLMGYFDMTGFPLSTVKTCEVPVMATFERLDVGVYNNTRHVFLTGEEALGGGHMADARLIGTDLWRFEISVNTAMVDRFDDVAVLTTGVSFSARETADKDGFLFFFPAPSMSPSMFSVTADYLLFSPFVAGRMLLDAGSGDNLAYVFQNTSGTDEVGFLYWNNVIQYYRVGAVPYTYRTTDISYGPTANKAELLTEDHGMYMKEIYTASCTSAYIPAPIPPYDGHTFPEEKIYSLDAVRSSSSLFVAAGVGDDANLAIYRYNRNSWPQECTERVSLPVDISDFRVLNNKKQFEGRSFDIGAIGVECQKTTIPVTTPCHEDRTDQ